MKKMLIIDGYSIAHRAYHALKDQGLQTKEGFPTGAIYGVIMMVMKLIEEENPDYLVTACDLGKTFRHEAYDGYKATRRPMDDEFRAQLPYIWRFFHLLGVKTVEIENFEADDIIGTMTTKAREEGIEVRIFSGDKDLFQLLTEEVTLLYPRRGITDKEFITAGSMKEKYHLLPTQWADFKALKGDQADNIPGVPGIGEKTALRLLSQFEAVDNLLERLDEVERPRERELLSTHEKELKLYKKLATIVRDLELPVTPADCSWRQPDPEVLAEFFTELEFGSLLKRYALEKTKAEVTTREFQMPEYSLLSEEDIPVFLEGADKARIGVQFLAEEASWLRGRALGVGLSFPDGRVGYLPLEQEKIGFPESLGKWFSDPKTSKIFYDAKTQMRLTWRHGLSVEGAIFDILIAAYLVSGGRERIDLDFLTEKHLALRNMPTVTDKRGKPFDLLNLPLDLAPEAGGELAVSRALILQKLYPFLEEGLRRNEMEKLFSEVETPLTRVLFAMEKEGIKVSSQRLKTLGEKFSARIRKLEEESHELAGMEFNLSSPKQLAEILFDRLNLPAIKKTKTGYSTDAEVLEELEERHPLVGKILEYRGLVKLNSTYVEALINLEHPVTGRIHTTFQQAVTATGRLSSTDPNLQNIPVRTEEGRQIRCCFVPEREEQVLLSADYSQIELRVMAHLSRDEKLIAAFKEEEDIHCRTAAEIFNTSLKEVTPVLRERAKAVNFGIIYGISGFGLAKGTGVTRAEAERFIAAYFQRYSGVKRYLDHLIKEARESGYVSTIFNRRRYLPDLKNRNYQRRSFAERMAMNTPIQGSAADLIKLAMVQVDRRLQEEGIPAKVLLQVHDELLVEVNKEAIRETAEILRQEMEGVHPLAVPLRVEIKTGKNWGDLVRY